MRFIEFPKIGQYHATVKTARNLQMKFGDIGPLHFRGYVKLHGTNSSIVADSDGNVHAQSRVRIIDTENDNAGFAEFTESVKWDGLIGSVIVSLPDKYNDAILSIHGEWCGGGLTKGVAISSLEEKIFVIFGMKIHDGAHSEWIRWEDMNLVRPDDRVYFINEFPYVELDIDFNNPDMVQNDLHKLTMDIEDECPVAKQISGKSGCGEGLVWHCTDERYNTSRMWFKTKGKKHSASKVKHVASADPELVKSRHEFIEVTVTENRLMQGIEMLKLHKKSIDRASAGDFIRWMYNDIVTEEATILEGSGLDPKSVGKLIADNVRPWYLNFVDHNYD